MSVINTTLKAVTIFLTANCFTFCSESNSSKSDRLIKKDLQENLNDYNSYQMQSRTKLDSLFTDPANTKEWEQLKSRSDSLKVEFEFSINQIKRYHELFPGGSEENEWLAKAKSLNANFSPITDSMKILIDSFKKEFTGWTMVLKFRAKNQYGANVLSAYKYDFDKDITKIVSRTDLTNVDK